MGLEAVKDMLPDYARDLKLNLSGLFNASPLTEQQLWGVVAAVAASSAPSPAVPELDEEAGCTSPPKPTLLHMLQPPSWQ